MSDKLKQAKASSGTGSTLRTTSTTMTTKLKEQREPPAGSKIVDETVRIETEEIENGWLISKVFDGRYKEKGSDDTQYYYYTKKWYSKTDPLEIKLADSSLADEFDATES